MPRHHHPRLQAITATDTAAGAPPLPFAGTLAADGRLHLEPLPRWRRYAWPAAILLHALIIALLLYLFRSPPEQFSLEPAGVSVVFDNDNARAAPSAPSNTIPPPPSPAPPPPTQASAAPAQPTSQPAAPDVNLNIGLEPPPPLPFDVPAPPPIPMPVAPAAPAAPHRVARTAPRPHPPSSKYMMLMGGTSFSSGAQSAAPPTPPGGLNLSTPMTDAQAMNVPAVTIQGDVGADWNAEFNKWVYNHIYYPQAALEQGQEGTSVISFVVHKDGHVTDVHLVSSAGSPFLDQAWLDIFIRNHVPKFPVGAKSDTVKITASLHYEIDR